MSALSAVASNSDTTIQRQPEAFTRDAVLGHVKYLMGLNRRYGNGDTAGAMRTAAYLRLLAHLDAR